MRSAKANPPNGGRPIHVLTLTPFYPSERNDAAGSFVAEPLGALARMNVTNTVFAAQPFYRGKMRAIESEITVRWFRYPSVPMAFGLPTAGAFLFARIVGLVRELHSSRPIDLIHAHAPLPCGHSAMLLSTELGVPFVVSVHGLDAFSTKQVRGLAGEWCRRISRRVYQSSHAVICVSEHVREQVFDGLGQACRTYVAYNGVDTELFSPGSKSPPDAPIVLSVGNLIPVKGHELLIRAVGSLAGTFPALTLEIIGDGPERSRLQDFAKQLQIGERVRFLGRQPRQQVAAAMQRCRVFAPPSRYEGLGCVYLEAMASGKPVIGCRGQGIEEVIWHRKNGWLVGVDDVEELANAVSTLLCNTSLRESIGDRGRQTILDGFTLTDQADQLHRIYRECVG